MVKNRSIFALAHKGLRDPDTVDALRDVGSEVRLLVALNLPCAPLAFLDKDNDADEHRESAQTDQGEPHMEQKHKDHNKNQVAHVCDGVDNAVGEQVAQTVYIVDHAHLYLAVRTVVIVGERQLLQMTEDIRAELVHDGLADAAGDAYLETDTHTGVEYDHKGQQRENDDRPDIFLRNISIHDLADKQGKEHGERGGGQHQKQRERKLAAVGLDILKDAL